MSLLYNHYEANPITNNNLKINAVSGTLCKTFRKSYFVRFQKGSPMEHFYFRDETYPGKIISQSSIRKYGKEEKWEYYENSYYELKEVVVLQVMLCSENNFLIEAIDNEDYEEMFTIKEN